MATEAERKQIYYEHRDSHLYCLQLEGATCRDLCYFKVISAEVYTRKKGAEVIDYRDYENYFSYKRNKQTKQNDILLLELKKKEQVPSGGEPAGETAKQDEDKLFIDAESFYTEVELKKKGIPNYVEISSVADYIKIIDMYKVVSLFVKCEAILTRSINKLEKRFLKNQNFKEELKQDFIEDLTVIRDRANKGKQSMLEIVQEFSSNKSMSRADYNAKIEKVIDDFISALREKNINNKREFRATADPSDIIRIMGDACRAITHALRLYGSGDYAMYYRGVGRIVYPEIPGVFRDNFKFEEDRQYKAMVMAFPKEFNGLGYLDRLAKLQHFGLPTRLLDVSSNPLVALYMACNTLYTGDSKQEDWGEIILYFMAGERDRAYDSKSLLINAALVKLSHSQITALFQFYFIHDVYIKKLEVSNPKLFRDILNDCIHLAHDYGVNAYLPDYEAVTLKNKISDAMDELLHIEKAKLTEEKTKKHDLDKQLAALGRSLKSIQNKISEAKPKIDDQLIKEEARQQKTLAKTKEAITNSKESMLSIEDTIRKLEAILKDVKSDSNDKVTACDLCWKCMQRVGWPTNGRNWRSVDEEDYANYSEIMEENDYRHLFRDVIQAYITLLSTIRRENPAFENRIDLFSLAKSYHGNIGMTNERILAQSGSFIIAGLDNYYINNVMTSTRSDGYFRLIIKDKKAISHELQILNITDATMLPDLSHKADYIRNQINNSDVLPENIQEIELSE